MRPVGLCLKKAKMSESDSQTVAGTGFDDRELAAVFNAQTGRVGWPELERAFARGVLIRVAPELDLVRVAVDIARDDAVAVRAWQQDGKVAILTDVEAQDWQTSGSEFWAVVAAPYVLAQRIANTLN